MTKQYYISVPMLKRAGACSEYRETLAELFGKSRQIPFNLQLAQFIVKVLGRDTWVADYVMTPAASRKFYEARNQIKRTRTDSAGNVSANPYYEYEVAQALQQTYRPRKELSK